MGGGGPGGPGGRRGGPGGGGRRRVRRRGRGRGRGGRVLSGSSGAGRTMVSSGGSSAGSYSCATAAFPQKPQKFASAGRGWPQWAQVTTGGEVTAGRPQCEQKWTPGGRGAPHLQWATCGKLRAATSAARSESSSCMRCSTVSTSPAREIRSSGFQRSRRTISTARPPTSRISISRWRASDRRSRRSLTGSGSGGGVGGAGSDVSTTSRISSTGSPGPPRRAKIEFRRSIPASPRV